jgi:hypothetical protein
VEKPHLDQQIRRALDSRGWVHIETPLSPAEFEALSQRLGSIDMRSDVVVDPVREQELRANRRTNVNRPALYQTAAMDFHTDRPSAHVLAWYCVHQDEQDGTNLLLDTHDLPEWFSAEELEALGTILVGCPPTHPTDEEEARYEPLVSRGAGSWKVYYMPWYVQTPADEDGARRLARFVQYLKEHEVIRVRLEEGESLFIDNRRIMHGRGPLPADSRRHLIRLYIVLAGQNDGKGTGV